MVTFTMPVFLAALLAGSPPEPTATLAFVGDVNLSALGSPEEDVFGGVRPLLERATHSVGNLEGILLEEPTPAFALARINITAHARLATVLGRSGLDAVGVANNHSWDHGAAGLLESLGHLRRTGLTVFGAGPDEATARAAHRVALGPGCVGVVPATLKSNKPPKPGAFAATYDPSRLAPLLARLRAERDAGCLAVAFVHAGKERSAHPTAQVLEAYRAMVEGGADLVVGSHPHVLEGVEMLPKGVIAYSLGNFLFRNQDPDKRRSGVLEVRLVRGDDGRPSIVEVALVPVTIDARSFLPRLATPAEATTTAALLAERSRPLGTRVVVDGARLVFKRE